ncbi:EF-P lysine aminoacylase EpmA [Pseudidiomarina sp. E22-M8]|uniref:EF-P lysine aminoacylase EpmA n=1 Tax=Pseudidiomarina sp. E22-M8 TaxID=3424768 RepID=UPI00403D4401
MQRSNAWQPSATLEVVRQRAALLAKVRAFFAARDVLEVDTPVLSHHGVSDVHLENLRTHLAGDPAPYFLQTSPEYAMKRLLAAGSGSIYQLGKVFRDDEQSPRHNPEFTLLEWYRVDYSAADLMQEIAALLQFTIAAPPTQTVRYQDLFIQQLGVDPLADDAVVALRQALSKQPGLAELVTRENDRDTLLDLAMATVIEPRLDAATPTFVTEYPASQAALAQINPNDSRVAQRFELFYGGVELVNGYQELTDAAEQQQRFQRDREQRKALSKPDYPEDTRLLAALENGLPECSGVALGFDRLLMIHLNKSHISEVLPFAIDRA